MEKDLSGAEEYWVPECVRAYLRGAGYSTRALEEMEPHVREWDRWMRAVGEFYDYRDTDGFGRVYQVHRRSIMPAMRLCREWGSLLLDERTVVACDVKVNHGSTDRDCGGDPRPRKGCTEDHMYSA